MLVISSYHQSFWQADNSLPFTDTRFPRLLSIVPRLEQHESDTSRQSDLFISKKRKKKKYRSIRLTRARDDSSCATWSMNVIEGKAASSFVSTAQKSTTIRPDGMHGSIHSNRLFLEKRRLNENLSTHVAKPAWPMTAFDHGRRVPLSSPSIVHEWIDD